MNYKNAAEQKRKFYTLIKHKDKLINSILTVVTIVSAIIALFVFGVVRSYYSAEVVGYSMFPTINAEGYYTEQKNQIAYYTTSKTPQKGDIVIVDYEKAGLTNVDAIKRLIAVGGDTICYYNGNILVNGKPVYEPYMQKAYNYLKNNKSQQEADNWKNYGYEASRAKFNSFCEQTLNGNFNATTFGKNYLTDYEGCISEYNSAIDGYVLTLPENFVFFLGDNRSGSTDCSNFGPLEKKYMLVKVDYIVDYGTNIFSAMWQSLLGLI